MQELSAATEVVATFELRDGLGDRCSMVVRHDPTSSRWFVELPSRVFAQVEPSVLDDFAVDLLEAVAWRPSEERRWREIDHVLFDDGDLDVVVTVGAQPEGPYLLVIAMVTVRSDSSGAPLRAPSGAVFGEFSADPADAAAVSVAARDVLGRLRPSR